MRRTWPALDIDFHGDIPDRDGLTACLLARIDDFSPDAIEHDDNDQRGVGRVFWSRNADRDRAAEALARQFGAAISICAVDVPDEGWAERVQAELKSIQVGRIVVSPPWDVPASPPVDQIVVVIRPSMGFGTGHHASTRLCLAALQREDLTGRSVLDLGTGSGVLAIAARRLGAGDVTALDVDEDAVSSARDNLQLNGLAGAVTVDVRGLEQARERADVVLANLTGPTLRRHAPHIASLVAPGGVLIASGLMEREEADVVEAFAPTLAIQHREEEEGWVGLMLRRMADRTIGD